jgi:cell division protein FtsI/penicillin-binding protein 2
MAPSRRRGAHAAGRTGSARFDSARRTVTGVRSGDTGGRVADRARGAQGHSRGVSDTTRRVLGSAGPVSEKARRLLGSAAPVTERARRLLGPAGPVSEKARLVLGSAGPVSDRARRVLGNAGRGLGRRGGAGSRAAGATGMGGNRGKRPGGLRSRPSLVAAAVAVLFGAVGFAGGLWSTPSAEPTVQAFLLAWQQRSYATAAALTSGNHAQVATALRNAFRGLGAAAFYLNMGHITQHGSRAQARFSASVDLGQDGAPWNYQGRLTLRQTGSGWKIVWSPSVINPSLHRGLHLAMVSSIEPRAPLLDARGKPLLTPSLAYVVGVRPDRLAHPGETAARLGRVTGLEAAELQGWIIAAPRGRFQELVVLRPSEYARLAHGLSKIPGLIIERQYLRLFSSIAPAVLGSVGTEVSPAFRDQGIGYRPGATLGLSGLQQAYQRKLAGTPSTKVITEDSSGHQVAVLASWQGRPPTPVRTTIDPGVQRAAMNAVASAPGSTAVVAMQASTGRILAVADHKGAGVPAIDPLAGQYRPATAFTIVSTEALLASGLSVGTPVRCTGVNDVGGRMFRNVPPVRNLGRQPAFAVDFANACGTAFSGLSQRLKARDLTNAAAGFGIGAPWRLPLPSFSGSVQASSSVADLAADTIGQGGVRTSPLAMALAASEADTGNWHEPSLVTPAADPEQARHVSLSASALDALRSLMRQTVHSGAAVRADLRGQPVYGQVGTAPLGPGSKHGHWVTWFVGFRGDMAFAVAEVSSSSAASAVPVGSAFLSAMTGP